MEDLRKRDITEISTKTQSDSTQTEAEARGSFANFPISEASARNLKKKGISYLFPIQYETFDAIYNGKDLIGRDRTGSGKTLAFALPILEKMRTKEKYFANRRGQRPYILCLVPTRELAIQVANEFNRFKNSDREYRVLTAYGGKTIQNQIDALRDGVEVVIGTPGRVIDLINRGELIFKKLRHLILDETDQMLNIGFQEDIELILRNIKKQFDEFRKSIDKIQFLLFSATVPKWVENISQKFMKPDFRYVDMIKHSDIKTSKTVNHLALCIASPEQKIPSVGDIVLAYGGAHSRTIIFTDKKCEANEVKLHGQLKLECHVLHGDIPQSQREVTFRAFREGTLKCLVATNVAARGLDIPEVDLIIQLSPPSDVETYIHRSGRTGRAGKSGTCITFYTRREQEVIGKIEREAKISFKKIGSPQPFDIARATGRDVGLSLHRVSPGALGLFTDTVKDILAQYSAEEALSRAIAIISGHTKPVQQKSLLSAADGLITYILQANEELASSAQAWGVLKKYLPSNVIDGISGMKLLANHRGVVFDLREERRNDLEAAAETMKQQNLHLSQARELPSLDERGDGQQFGNGGGFGGNGYKPQNDLNQRHSSNGNSAKDDSKIFIGNLSFDTTEEELKSLVISKGFQITDAYLVKGPNGTSRGFGYAKLADARQIKNALEELGRTKFQGRSLKVDYADRKN